MKPNLLKSIFLLSIILLLSCEKEDPTPLPVVLDQTIIIDEHLPAGSYIGQVLVINKNRESTYTFSIVSGNSDGAFSLTSSGELLVENETVIDFDLHPFFSLSIEVKDEEGSSSIGKVMVRLNEQSMPGVVNQVIEVEENSIQGTIVGQILTCGNISNSVLTYNIMSGNTENAFSVNNYGEIVVENENAMDYEKFPEFTLTVEIQDSNDRTSYGTIRIKLQDAVIPADGLVLYMPFDGSTIDLSEYNNHGIDYTSKNYLGGIKGEALDFNGYSDYIKLSQTINAEDGLSFSFWLLTRGALENQYNGIIISKYDMSAHTRSFLVNSFGTFSKHDPPGNNRLGVAFFKYGFDTDRIDMVKSYMVPEDLTRFSNSELWTFHSPQHLVLNEWTHCVINVTNTNIEIWLNGELTVKKQREYNTYFDSQEPVYIGNIMNGGKGSNNHFNGVLDELRVYRRGFTEEEIRTLFKE